MRKCDAHGVVFCDDRMPPQHVLVSELSSVEDITEISDARARVDLIDQEKEGGGMVLGPNGFPRDDKLFQHQLDILGSSISRFGGRSVVTIAPGWGRMYIGVLFLNHYINQGKRALVVCPTSHLYDWAQEYVLRTGESKDRVEIISWQKARSRMKKQTSYFEQFGVAVVDQQKCSDLDIASVLFKIESLLVLRS